MLLLCQLGLLAVEVVTGSGSQTWLEADIIQAPDFLKELRSGFFRDGLSFICGVGPFFRFPLLPP